MFWKSHKEDDEKKRLRSVFGHLVSPSVVESLLKGELSLPPFTEEQLEFIIAIVVGGTPEEMNRYFSLIGELAREHDAQVNAMTCSLVVIHFWHHPEGKLACESRRKLVGAIHEKLGDKVKVVHGAAKGHYGLYGSEKHIMSFTFTFPGFEAAIATLARLKFGEMEELIQ
ncbi:MAG: hypothetical protein ABMA26_21090 [Limisphaerales bacterium]